MTPKSKYNGVKRDNYTGLYRSEWKVQFKSNGRVLSIFRHENETACAWVSDFCRYMRYGLDLAKWPSNAKRPNFAPCRVPEIDREIIIERLINGNAVSEAVLRRHVQEYDALAAKIRPPA